MLPFFDCWGTQFWNTFCKSPEMIPEWSLPWSCISATRKHIPTQTTNIQVFIQGYDFGRKLSWDTILYWNSLILELYSHHYTVCYFSILALYLDSINPYWISIMYNLLCPKTIKEISFYNLSEDQVQMIISILIEKLNVRFLQTYWIEKISWKFLNSVWIRNISQCQKSIIQIHLN